MKHEIEHGGALDRAIARYGGERRHWLDLSTGINPESFVLPDFAAEVWHRLPDESLYSQALVAARRYYGAQADTAIVAAPGTQALIQLMPHLLPPANVAIIGPTYQEHAAAFAQAGWTVTSCASLDSVPAAASVAVVVNPNNPDGRVHDQQSLIRLAQQLGRRGGLLIVDEAFADSQPQSSLVAHIDTAPVLILKSFGKFFGLAGVRLGFALSNRSLIDRLTMRLGPWAVSGPALAIARHAFENPALRQAFHQRLLQRRLDLRQALAGAGVREAGGCDLFSLVEVADAAALHDWLCRQHILVRKFDYAPGWLRIGLAEQPADLQRLTDAVKSFASS